MRPADDAGGVIGREAVTASALYVGKVGHVRFRPKTHQLGYGVFMLLLDLDSGPALAAASRWLSWGRFNLLSFHPRDYGDGSDTPLATQARRALAAAGIAGVDGPVRLLCLPRVLGYVFNPLSLYFCHRADGSLGAIIYEVSSTFHRRHSYVIPADPDPDGVVRQCAEKRLHVSPFIGMDMRYAFRIVPPGEAIAVGIDVFDPEGRLLSAWFRGERRPVADRDLLRAWLSHPLLTLKVIVGIHWEAVKLLVKGVRLRPGPPDPRAAFSLGRSIPDGEL